MTTKAFQINQHLLYRTKQFLKLVAHTDIGTELLCILASVLPVPEIHEIA